MSGSAAGIVILVSGIVIVICLKIIGNAFDRNRRK